MEFLNNLLFGIYPYIALAVFVVGSLARYDRDQYSWKAGSSQLLESKMLRKGSMSLCGSINPSPSMGLPTHHGAYEASFCYGHGWFFWCDLFLRSNYSNHPSFY